MDPTPTYDKAQSIMADAQASYERLRGDQRITDDYRRQPIAAAYVKARDQVNQLREDLTDNRDTELKRLELKAFAVEEKDIPSYRDALDRTEPLQTTDEGLQLRWRAVRIGDTLQLKALATWAADHGADQVLTALAEHLPDQVDAISALSIARQQNRNARLLGANTGHHPRHVDGDHAGAKRVGSKYAPAS